MSKSFMGRGSGILAVGLFCHLMHITRTEEREARALVKAVHAMKMVWWKLSECGQVEGACEDAMAQLPSGLERWAMLHALGEEHERMSWREGAWSSYHGRKAFCYYLESAQSPAHAGMSDESFLRIFGRALRVAGSSRNMAMAGDVAGEGGGALSRGGGESAETLQGKQCNATLVEHERWRERREAVRRFALNSVFHPWHWRKHLPNHGAQSRAEGPEGGSEELYRHAQVQDVLVRVMEKFWVEFSPWEAGRYVLAGEGEDLLTVFSAVEAWRGRRDRAHRGVDGRWWDRLLRGCAVDGPSSPCPEGQYEMVEKELDGMKVLANARHLQLNAHMNPYKDLSSTGAPQDTLPIWLRACRRTFPLSLVLQRLRSVWRIRTAVLIVTVDRDMVEGVLRELSAVDFMHVRVYFHPFTETRASLGFHGWDTGVHRLNAHYVFGLRLSLVSCPFDYVITLEDDLLPSPDFLVYHQDMRKVATSDPNILSILAYPNGPVHDCSYIKDKLLNRSVCQAGSADMLYNDRFFAGWGAGLSRLSFLRFLPVWNFSGIYDGIMNGLIDHELHCLAPCRPRVRLHANVGLHGESEARWDDVFKVDEETRPEMLADTYKILNHYKGLEYSFKGRSSSGIYGRRVRGDRRGTAVARHAEQVEVWELLQRRSAARRILLDNLCNGSHLRSLFAAAILGSTSPSTEPPPFVVWSSDFHVGPIADLKDIWQDLRVRGRRVTVIDKSLSGSCSSQGTCAQGLRVVNGSNGQDLGPSPSSLIQQFVSEYSDDPLMDKVDAFVCNHPPGMCELFQPLNKSVIVHASTRYEMGRCFSDARPQGCSDDPARWKEWNQKVSQLMSSRKDFVSANNRYDARYMQFFLGRTVETIPSLCDKRLSWFPRRSEILLSMPQAVEQALTPPLLQALQRRGLDKTLKFVHIRRLYRRYEHADLAQHPAIVWVPYQVSVMSFFEQYRMNIPILVPSLQLMADWIVLYGMMPQRTWAGVFGQCPVGSSIPPHPSESSVPDPNDDSNMTAVKFWLQFADFYSFPHVLQWSSFDELVDLASDSDRLFRASQGAREFNLDQGREVRGKWKSVFESILTR